MSISHYSYKYGHGSKEFSLESDRVIKESNRDRRLPLSAMIRHVWPTVLSLCPFWSTK